MRARALVPIVAAVIVMAGLSLYVLRSQTPPPVAVPPTTATSTAAPSPTPTATATPTSQPTPSPTARPSPTPVGLFVSADMGYALELKPSWHRSTCGSSTSGGPAVGTNGGDMFIAIPEADFQLGHVGPFSGNTDLLHMSAIANPTGLSLREFKRERFGSSSGETIEDATFAGRAALKVTEGQDASFLFANGGYVWQIGHRLRTGNSSFADREAMMLSFRFLTPDEARAARAAATLSPAPRTAEQVVDVLADGFSKRDVTILARVIRPCFYEGVYQAGPESMVAEKYLEKLRQRFAQGLVVEVRTRPISGDATTTLRIRSTWREPGQPAREADLSMTVHRGTTYWDGTTACMFGPCP